MHIREKQIGGQPCYEIVEEARHSTGSEYRVIVSLGKDREPENARRRRHTTLLGLERSLQRLEPLRAANPRFARKCDALNHRIDRERQKIAELTNAIESLGESLAETPERASEYRNGPDAGRALKLVSNRPAAVARRAPGEATS
ncbi:MAG: hypothetical protein QF449_03985 [Alphaproteobacteria bacterium]|jgi:septal ring factor EnvC (AmiA/AmiB activator)|nr:hypothetical protein [Alphaproteobacteria bacterium]MDP6589822.1 hypothetical protein [Alphaproteobacteria bacterium]MDP6817189.1 hypothetical protein [Alphaproteobacteria bacterium]|tara:strand:+ start:572 stop:1003 length:432 start_codon:yes stop_codon:yes gene_type:complete